MYFVIVSVSPVGICFFFFFLSHRMSVQLSLLTFKLPLFLCRSNVYVCYFAFAPCKQSNRALFPGRRGEGGLEEVAFLSLSVSCLYLDLSSPLCLIQALSLSQSGRIRTKHKVNSAGVGHSNEWLCVNVNTHTYTLNYKGAENVLVCHYL